MAGLQQSLITEDAINRLLSDIEDIVADIVAHREAGLDAHAAQTILDQPYLDSNGNVVAEKTLKIGANISGVPVYVLVPAVPTS